MTAMDQLIERCIKGERKAQRELYNLFSAKMFVVALRYTKARQEAEDILQESFIKVFDRIKGFTKKAKLETWIHKIVINTALNNNRGKLYMFPMSDVEVLTENEDDEMIISGYSLDELLEMIRELPTGCQVIFNLFAIEGYNHREIAKKLNISAGTSKSQYARAKMLLQKRLKKESVHYG